MAGSGSEYFVPYPRNRLRRRHERGQSDREPFTRSLTPRSYRHIAYVIDGQPFCTPNLILARENAALLARLLRQSDGT